MHNDPLDLIYEAAFQPDMWGPALDTLAGSVGAASASVLVFDRARELYGRGSSYVDEALSGYLRSGVWRAQLPLLDVLRRMPPEFYVAHPDEPQRNNLDRLGLGIQRSTFISTPSDEKLLFTIERWADAGDFDPLGLERLNAMRPHLARAGLLAVRMGLERAQTMVATLEQIGLAGAVLAHSGRVVAANAGLDNSNSFVALAGGRLALKNQVTNAAMQDAIRLLADGHAGASRSIPLPATDDDPAMIIHLLPVRRTARDPFAGAEIILAVSSVGRSPASAATLLEGLFDLTAAEARIAQALLGGMSVAEIAADSSIAVSTVRTQLSSIFFKTGTSRQAELIALLSAAAPIGSEDPSATRPRP